MGIVATYDVVIVGGSLAGITCAQALRTEGFDGTILIVGDERYLPYNRPPLSKQVLLNKWQIDQTALISREKGAELNIEFVLGRAATGLDLASKALLVGRESYHFSKLIIATGVSPRNLVVQGDVDDVLFLRTVDDVLAIKERLGSSKRIAMVGAGVLGCEMTSAFAQLGHQVQLIERLAGPQMPNTGGHISQKIHAELVNNGINTHYGVAVRSISRVTDGIIVELDNSSNILVDMVVASIGSVPNTQWLPSDLIDTTDGVLCDSTGLVVPNVYAIGDVARWQLRSEETAKRIENQTSAINQALAVAKFIVSGTTSPTTEPFFWSEIFEKKILLSGTLDPDPGSVRVLNGDFSGDKFIIATEVNGSYTGILSWNMPREFREARKLLKGEVNG